MLFSADEKFEGGKYRLILEKKIVKVAKDLVYVTITGNVQ